MMIRKPASRCAGTVCMLLFALMSLCGGAMACDAADAADAGDASGTSDAETSPPDDEMLRVQIERAPVRTRRYDPETIRELQRLMPLPGFEQRNDAIRARLSTQDPAYRTQLNRELLLRRGPATCTPNHATGRCQ